MKLASCFGRGNQIGRERKLARKEIIQVVPSELGDEKYASRSEH
ncbi:hypothetical protein [Pantoea agglomerans]|nr:hypothetical protein [Pantoea agglomerans]